MPPLLAFHLLLIAETKKETAPSYVWRKGAKTLEVYCTKSTINAMPNQFRYQKKNKQTKKETKRAGEMGGNSLLLYFDQENSEISKASLFNLASRKFLIVMF